MANLGSAVDEAELAEGEDGPDGLVGGAVQVAVLLPHLQVCCVPAIYSRPWDHVAMGRLLRF